MLRLLIPGTALFFAWLARHPTVADPDLFYHARMALLSRAGYLPIAFPWLPFTVIAERFADQQFFYHLILVPFVRVFPPLLGIKIAGAIFATLAVIGFYILARELFPRFALLATLSLLFSYPFLFRMSLGKAQPLAFFLLFLFLLMLLRKRWTGALCLVFLSVWTHGSWPMVVALGMLFVVLPPPGRIQRTMLIAIPAVALAGLVLHPSFPHTFSFFWHQTIRIALLETHMRGVGAEWAAPTLSDIAAMIPLQIFFLLFTFLLFLRAVRREQRDERTFFFFVSALIGAMLFLHSNRHVEFFIPFITLAFFLLCDKALRAYSLRLVMSQSLKSVFRFPLTQTFGSIVLAIALSIMLVGGIWRADRELSNGIPASYLEGVARWARENIPAGAVIVASDWDIFPELFFHDEAHRYVAGLDPRFLLFADADRFNAFAHMIHGSDPTPAHTLQEYFDTRYLLVAHEHAELLRKAEGDRALQLLYRDADASLFSLRPSQNYP